MIVTVIVWYLPLPEHLGSVSAIHIILLSLQNNRLSAVVIFFCLIVEEAGIES